MEIPPSIPAKNSRGKNGKHRAPIMKTYNLFPFKNSNYYKCDNPNVSDGKSMNLLKYFHSTNI